MLLSTWPLWPRRTDERNEFAGQSACAAGKRKGLGVNDLRRVRIGVINPGRKPSRLVRWPDDLQILRRRDNESAPLHYSLLSHLVQAVMPLKFADLPGDCD